MVIKELHNIVNQFEKETGSEPQEIAMGRRAFHKLMPELKRMNHDCEVVFGGAEGVIVKFDGIPVKVLPDPSIEDQIYVTGERRWGGLNQVVTPDTAL